MIRCARSVCSIPLGVLTVFVGHSLQSRLQILVGSKLNDTGLPHTTTRFDITEMQYEILIINKLSIFLVLIYRIGNKMFVVFEIL